MPSVQNGGRFSRPIHSLVLDTAPLLTLPYGQIKSFNASNYYTVPLAKEEVKDETARAALEIWGQELKIRQPQAKSIQEVTSFAKKTGDYEMLSVADIHILALTYELECELNHGDWRLHKEPGSKERRGQPPPKSPRISAVTNSIPFPEDKDDDDDTRSIISNITTATITPSESASTIFHNPFQTLRESSSESSTPRTQYTVPSQPKAKSTPTESVISTTSTTKATLTNPSLLTTESLVSRRTSATDDTFPDTVTEVTETTTSFNLTQSLADLTLDSSSEDDGEGAWITQANIKKHKIRDTTTTNPSTTPYTPSRRRSSTSDRPVGGGLLKAACMTSDYAMQNVALQMGLNLISTNGEGIRQVKTWILRCHGCFSTTKKMDARFCPRCGGDTLLRTSTSTNANGEVKIHLKKNMQWTNRGTKFSLPKPRGMTATPSLSAPPPILRADQKEYQHALAAKKKREKDLMDPDNIPSFLEGKGRQDSFGFGGRSAGRIGGGRGRGTNAVRRR